MRHGRSPSPALDESSLAQMQERLHAEFLQSVSFKQVYYYTQCLKIAQKVLFLQHN